MPEISIEPQQNLANPETNPTVSKSKLRKMKNTLSWDAFTKNENSLKTLLQDKEVLKATITSQNPEQMFDALTIFNTATNYLGSSDYSSFEPPENKDGFVKLAQEVVNYNCENGVFDGYLDEMDRKISQRTMLNKILHKTPSAEERKKEIQDKIEVRKDVLNLVVFAISNSSPGSAEKAVDFLAKNLASTLKLAQDGVATGSKDERASIIRLLSPLSSKITASDAKPLADSLISLLENKQFQETAMLSIKQLEANPIVILDSGEAPDELAAAIIDRTLDKYNFDQKDRQNILSNWLYDAPMGEDDAGTQHGRESVAENFGQLLELENERPGIAKRLYEKFGITYFARYPIDLLVEQDKKFQEGFSGKYGLIVSPMYDNNGSFYGDKNKWEKLFNQTRNADYSLCVWEADNINDFVHTVNTSRKEFGLISFAIVGGHGTSRRHSKENAFIRFGNKRDYKEGILAQSDLGKKGAEAFRTAFIDHPKIILNSCNTGERDGIAQLISKTLDTKTIGPNEVAVFKRIDFSVDDTGNPTFNVEYTSPHSAYDKGSAVDSLN